MSREVAVLIMVSVAVILLALMLWGWRRRLRRDSGVRVPTEVPQNLVVLERYEVFYVATTRHDQPLERIALPLLAYRAAGEVVLSDRGVGLNLDGTKPIFFPRDMIVDADLATWTIDRVVEKGGLIRLVWRSTGGENLDSYLRIVANDPQPFLTTLHSIITNNETGASQ